MAQRYFLDTFFAIALFNPRDRYHATATKWFTHMRDARQVWTTEAVLVEIADGLSAVNRIAAGEFIRHCREATNARIVSTSEVFQGGLNIYLARHDKTWGLTDCISFEVMRAQGLSDALTADEHFSQAGFRAVLSE